MRVVDWCASQFVRLICCQITLTASSPRNLLISYTLAIHLLIVSPLPSDRMRFGTSCSRGLSLALICAFIYLCVCIYGDVVASREDLFVIHCYLCDCVPVAAVCIYLISFFISFDYILHSLRLFDDIQSFLSLLFSLMSYQMHDFLCFLHNLFDLAYLVQ